MEGAKVIKKVNLDLLTNKILNNQPKITVTDKLDTDLSTSDYCEKKPSHSFQSGERRILHSSGRRFDLESQVKPESIHTVHITESENNNYIFKNVKVTEKSSFKPDNIDKEVIMNIKPTKNKNQTLRLAKRRCSNSSTNISLEHNEEQISTRKDVYRKEKEGLPTYDGERDENRNHLQKKPEGFKDFIVLCSKEDYDAAMAFQEKLFKLGIPNLTVDNFEHIDPEKSEMESIFSLHEQCNTVLLFATHNYINDKIRRRQAEMLLLKSLETEGLEHWVVPVWVEKDVKKSIPEWAPIKGIQLQKNQAYFSKQITDLLMAGRKRSIY